MIQIKDWSEKFENANSRKLERIDRFDSPARCDSNGYLELSGEGEAGMMALGVFQALCQAMAGQRRTNGRSVGTFLKSSGEMMPIKSIASLCRISVTTLENAMPLLKSIGWVKYCDSVTVEDSTGCNSISQSSPNHLPSSPTDPPLISHPSPDKTRQDKTRQDKPKQEKATIAPTRNGSEPNKERDRICWTKDLGFTGITETDRAEWSIAYPACSIERQLAAANQWLLANPAKAHKKAWRRFVTGWLQRSQEKGGDIKSSAPAPAANIPEPEGFDKFWDGCPVQRNRAKAAQAYSAALQRGVTPEQINRGLEGYRLSEKKKRRSADHLELHPATWLNNDGFLDRVRRDPAPGEIVIPEARAIPAMPPDFISWFRETIVDFNGNKTTLSDEQIAEKWREKTWRDEYGKNNAA